MPEELTKKLLTCQKNKEQNIFSPLTFTIVKISTKAQKVFRKK